MMRIFSAILVIQSTIATLQAQEHLVFGGTQPYDLSSTASSLAGIATFGSTTVTPITGFPNGGIQSVSMNGQGQIFACGNYIGQDNVANFTLFDFPDTIIPITGFSVSPLHITFGAMNANGEAIIAGYSQARGNVAFFSSFSSPIAIQIPLDSDTINSVAINSKGHAVIGDGSGNVFFTSFSSTPTVAQVTVDIGQSFDTIQAVDINNEDQVAIGGFYEFGRFGEQNSIVAFSNFTLINPTATSLILTYGETTAGVAINDSGQTAIALHAFPPACAIATFSTSTISATQIDGTSGYDGDFFCIDMNNSGEIIMAGSTGGFVATFADPTATQIDIPGFTTSYDVAINDQHEAVLVGSDTNNGTSDAYFFTFTSSPTPTRFMQLGPGNFNSVAFPSPSGPPPPGPPIIPVTPAGSAAVTASLNNQSTIISTFNLADIPRIRLLRQRAEGNVGSPRDLSHLGLSLQEDELMATLEVPKKYFKDRSKKNSKKVSEQALPEGSAQRAAKKESPFAIWVLGFENWTVQKGQHQSPGFHVKAGSGFLGIDYYGVQNHALNGTIAYGRSNTTINKGFGSARIDSYALFLNDLYSIGKSFIELGLLGVYNKNRTQRILHIGGIKNTAESKYSGWEAGLHLGVGYDYYINRISTIHVVEPYATADYIYNWQNSHSEQGAGSQDLNQPNSTSSVLQTNIGLNYYIMWDKNWGFFILRMTAAYIYRAGFDVGKVEGVTFVGQTDAFTIPASPFVQNLGSPAIELFYRAPKGFFCSLVYDGEFSSVYASNSVMGKIGVYF
jgi:hypothetical protein